MIKTSATLKRCPKFDSHMQAHCGYATAALGSGPLPCRPISSGRDRAALFFKALNAILDGHPPCQALGSASEGGGGGGGGAAKVSHPRVAKPHRPKDAFSPSL